eukprot:1152132-Pelagomonas_calceolata.AAC.1
MVLHHLPLAVGAAAGAADGAGHGRSCEERAKSKHRPRQPSLSPQDSTGNESDMGPSQEVWGVGGYLKPSSYGNGPILLFPLGKRKEILRRQ